MTLEELKKQLSDDYELVCFEDLAAVLLNQKNLYSVLEKYYQKEYTPEQKLIFYTAHRPSSAQLCVFQSAVSDVDISNFFILICSPFDLSADLIFANSQHGFDDVVIEHLVCNIAQTNSLQSDVADIETMCPLPWMHLEVLPTRDISPCCVNTMFLGKVEDLQTKNLFYTKDMQQLRQQLLAGEKPTSCNYCWQRESHNQISHRQRQLSLYKKELLSNWIYDPKIRSLDLRLGNTCNFKCRICHIPHSSLRIREELKFAETIEKKQSLMQSQIFDQNLWFDNIDKFFEDLNSIWGDLLNIDIIGGEPFFLKNLPDILDHIIDIGHADHIRLHITTNGSVYPKNIIDRLCKFKFIDIAISIDNIEDRFELERGGSWSTIVNNVKQFLALDKSKFRSYAYCTVNIQNVLYLDDLLSWCESENMDLIFNILELPEYFSINQLTEKAKWLVMEKYKNSSHPQLQAMAQQVMVSSGSDGKRFIDEIKKFDKRRNENFLLSHKTIAEAMGLTL